MKMASGQIHLRKGKRMSKHIEKNVARIVYLTLVLLATGFVVFPFIIPVIFAASIALAMHPLHHFLMSKGLGPRQSAGLLTFIFTVVISIPLLFFVIKGVSTVTSQLQEVSFAEIQEEGVTTIVEGIKNKIVVGVHNISAKFNADSFFTTAKINLYLKQAATILLGFFQAFLASAPLVFLFLLITVACTYSFLKFSNSIRRFFQELFSFDDERMDELVKTFINDSRQVYISNLVTGGVQALCVATGAAATGTADFFLIFFITLVLAFIPVIGAAPVAFGVAAVAFFNGNTTGAIIMGIVGLFSGLIDNFLRPWLASFGESRIPPIAAFIFVLGGAILLGFPGLFLGLLLGSIAYDTLPFFWEVMGKTRSSQSEKMPIE
jgi:predicted PurR-regulated permease PerM